MKRITVLSLVAAFVVTSAGASFAATRFVTMGTGGVTGVYYPTGGAISKLVNNKRNEYNLRMTVESTGGSVFNVNAIAAGDLEMGVVQSDLQYQAYNGKGEWEGKPVSKLRAVFLHPSGSSDDSRCGRPEYQLRRRPEGKSCQYWRPRLRSAGQLHRSFRGRRDQRQQRSQSSRGSNRPSRPACCRTAGLTPSSTRSAIRMARSRRRSPVRAR